MTKEKRVTMKEKVLRFVESKNACRFVDIQEFIVDTNYSTGTYRRSRRPTSVYVKVQKRGQDCRWVERTVMANPYRGYYCTAFSGLIPYFLIGTDYLEKGEDGLWRAVRDGIKKYPPKHTYRYRYPKHRNHSVSANHENPVEKNDQAPPIIAHQDIIKTDTCSNKEEDVSVGVFVIKENESFSLSLTDINKGDVLITPYKKKYEVIVDRSSNKDETDLSIKSRPNDGWKLVSVINIKEETHLFWQRKLS